MTVSRYVPLRLDRAARAITRAGRPLGRAGHLAEFFAQGVVTVPVVLRHYRRELQRLLIDILWGNGSLVVGGGTAAVVIVLGAIIGALIGVEGYAMLNLLGLGPATGFLSSLVSTRELAPLMAAMAFAMQAGCRFTAQLGAMRICEEIDATESLAIRPIPYLVTTRLIASSIAVLPLYIACIACMYLSCQLVVAFSGNSSMGSYMHYFSMMLSGTDIIFSVIKAVVFVWIASTIQCYYGFYAVGGPEGVGIAAGHAMRSCIIVMITANMLLTMALWGVDSGARFGG
ncbi:ABC transporter permease [Mycobacteroides chelonae]|uniref:ABC transporter permease n=1 Tax=Mycobacteroides chelonae TaxID=1774 RepID=UPI0008A9CF65|nr:ABC transporter permease [Mycobacteroides chelonae]OHU24877.1 ABC transporter permease [Mycobacteroides chelonae]